AAYPLLVGAGVAVALALSLSIRPSGLATAIRLDRALGLKDRLGTADAIRRGRARGELADLARLQAERLAEALDVRLATPIRFTRIWAVAVLLTVGLWAGVAFLPAFVPGAGAATTSNTPQLTRQSADIVETISDAVTDLDREGLDEASREDLETLDELARQLSGEPATEAELAEARDRSAAQLEQVADRLAEQSDRTLEAVDEVTRRFREIEVPPEAPEPVEALAEALFEGDLEQAADRFDELMEARQEMTPEAQQQTGEELRQLADQLEPTRDDPDLVQRTNEIREALEDLGLDEESARELLEQMDPQAREQALREQDLEPDAAQQLTEDLQELREQQQVREQADEQQRQLAEALEDAAEQLDRPEAQQQQPGEPPEARPEPQPEPQPAQPRQEPGQPVQEVPQERPGEQPQAQPEGQPEPQPGAEPQQGPGQVPDQVPQRTPGEAPDQAPQEVPGQAPGQAPPQPPSQPVGGDEAGEQRQERPSVGEALRRLGRARRDAMERRQDSERLRQAARELADTLSEDEKRALAERWLPKQDPSPGAGRVGEGLLQEQPPDGTPPFDTIEDIDLRGDDEVEGRIIAEWLDPEGAQGGPGPPARGRALARKAQTDAERAVEKAVVPSRYHKYIQRYFGRLEETVDKAAAAEPSSGDDKP
ncbi:MAG: hypothetical protein ACYTBR_09880, partial [Planctomycetota bacterium]